MSEAAKTVPTWLPDWGDGSAYPAKYDDWGDAQWAWAFLRRNADYQADFANFDAMREGGDSVYGMAYEVDLCRKWHLTRVTDPTFDLGWEAAFSYTDSPLEELSIRAPEPWGYIHPQPSPDEFHHVTLRFDLRFNIEKQLEDAKRLLLDQRVRLQITGVKAATKGRDKFPLYLRVFDAKLAGIGTREIARKLIPSKANKPESQRSADADISRAEKAAAALVAGDYKKLAIFCS